MTDCELLELAAKAAGWSAWDWLASDEYLNVYSADGRHDTFAPLTDDGDALRLAVKLGIHVIPGEEGDPYAVAIWWVRPERIKQDFERVLVDVDRAAAVRRAIVRAAAEIGKSMP